MTAKARRSRRSWPVLLAAWLLGAGGLDALAARPASAAPPPGAESQTLPFGEINWERGYIKVSAIGLPPFGQPAGASAREVARQNAVELAQKRLLGVLFDVPARGRKLRDWLGERPALKGRLRDLIREATVGGKTYSDGSVEITLTLSTDALAALLREL